MIPSVPVPPPATHVEHFSPIRYQRQMKLRRILRVPFPFESARSCSLPRHVEMLFTPQDISRLLSAGYPCMPLHIARPPYARLGGVADYYRGNDLQYASNVNAPVAQSVNVNNNGDAGRVGNDQQPQQQQQEDGNHQPQDENHQQDEQGEGAGQQLQREEVDEQSNQQGAVEEQRLE